MDDSRTRCDVFFLKFKRDLVTQKKRVKERDERFLNSSNNFFSTLADSVSESLRISQFRVFLLLFIYIHTGCYLCKIKN